MTTSPTPVHLPHKEPEAPASSATSGTKATAVAVLALNMSWQLLIVVVGPVSAGHWADGHFGISPWCTVAGMILSLVGMVTVVKLTLKQLNTYMQIDKKESK
jgi:hypothetical protein